jgi:hypothetical protein
MIRGILWPQMYRETNVRDEKCDTFHPLHKLKVQQNTTHNFL